MTEKTIAGRYRLLQKIAVGGTSDIYFAQDIKLKRDVAIKILARTDATDRAFVAKFKKEAQILAKLNDPHIVSVYDWGEYEDSYFICMEYIRGRSLKDIIEKQGIIDAKTASVYAIQICEALEVAHQNNLIHRDIKPQNILVTEDGKIKVTDFGIAKSLAEDSTKTINIMGTANYISPEQAQGKILDSSTDIYSLGIVIYEMLTADLPFRGASSIDITLKHINEKPMEPSILVDGIPHGIEKIVMKCLEKEPKDRYRDAFELKEDLQNFLQGRPLIAQKVPKKDQKRRKRSMFAALQAKGKRRQSKESAAKMPLAQVITQSLSLVIAFVFLALFLLFFFRYHEEAAQNQFVTVPPLEDIEIDAARRLASAAGLEVLIDSEVYHERVPQGHIIAQSPAGRASVLQESAISVTVSLGVERKMVQVPNLVGLDIEKARDVLAEANLKTGLLTYRHMEESAEDIVVFQNPPFGTVLPEENAIDLRISLGPSVLVLPNIIGWDYMLASSHLESADLVVFKKRVTNFEYQPGSVVRVDPLPGTRLNQRDVVTVYVATTEEMKVVPDVTQISVENAMVVLEGQELEYEVSYVETEFGIQKGTVLKQDPAYLDTISKGQKVILFVGR